MTHINKKNEPNEDQQLTHIINKLKAYPGNVVALSDLSKLIGTPKIKNATQEVWFHFLNKFLQEIDGKGDLEIKRKLISKLNKNITETLIKSKTTIIQEKITHSTFKSKDKKPRLILLICIWKRPELTNFILNYYNKLKKEYRERVEIIVICIGSEKNKSKFICEKNDCIYLEHPNEPLSRKWGFGFKAAIKYHPDGVVTLGSDDLISKNTIERYIKCIENNELFLGFYDVYFYSKKHSLIHWDGYGYSAANGGMPGRIGETIGAGRFYSKYLLHYLDYNLWGELNINNGLDLASSKKLEHHGILNMKQKHAIQLKQNESCISFGQLGENLSDSNSFILDIKTDTSLTKLYRYTGSPHHHKKIPDKKSFLLNHFPEEVILNIFRISSENSQV